MAIKMRVNKKLDSVCCECGKTRRQVLDMFDIQINGETFTLCDVCNDTLFYKTLRATCYTNGRVKSKEDMLIINERGRRAFKEKELAQNLKLKDEVEKFNKEEDNYNE